MSDRSHLKQETIEAQRAARRHKVRDRTLFTALVLFDDMDHGLVARRALIGDGYEFDIQPEIDPYSRTIFVELRRAVQPGLDEETLCNHLDAIVDQLGGFILEAGLVDNPLLERRLHRPQ